MHIYSTEFKCEIDAGELCYIRKGLVLLKDQIQKKPGGWRNKGKDAIHTIEHILKTTEGLL